MHALRGFDALVSVSTEFGFPGQEKASNSHVAFSGHVPQVVFVVFLTILVGELNGFFGAP